MRTLEFALSGLEGKLSEVQRIADALAAAIRRVRGGAKSGQIADIEKALAVVSQRAQEAAVATGSLAGAWQFNVGEYLSAGYLDELREAASEAGLNLFE